MLSRTVGKVSVGNIIVFYSLSLFCIVRFESFSLVKEMCGWYM